MQEDTQQTNRYIDNIQEAGGASRKIMLGKGSDIDGGLFYIEWPSKALLIQ